MQAVSGRKQHLRFIDFAIVFSALKNEHVLSDLVRKRAGLANQIECTQLQLRKLVTELDAIDAAYRIFDREADTGAVPNR